MRAVLVQLHRYLGLALAGVLVIAGLTGSLIAFERELDAALNPELFQRRSSLASLPLDRQIAAFEAEVPEARVSAVFLPVADRSTLLQVAARDAEATLPYDQVFIDPATGAILGQREWGACCFARPNLLPFLYKLHFSLHLPGVAGPLLLGIAALLWFVDCFIGAWLTLPRDWRRFGKWRLAWSVKRGAQGLRLHLDLHRAGGLWLWAVLATLAMSGVALNLREQVFLPVVTTFADVSPPVAERIQVQQRESLVATTISFDQAVAAAIEHARPVFRDRVQPYYVFHNASLGAYGVAVAEAGHDPRAGLGPAWFYVSAADGRLLTSELPGAGTAADVFVQAQFPLHSGQIAGLPGRVLVSATGLVVVMLSLTGVYLWWRRRRV